MTDWNQTAGPRLVLDRMRWTRAESVPVAFCGAARRGLNASEPRQILVGNTLYLAWYFSPHIHNFTKYLKILQNQMPGGAKNFFDVYINQINFRDIFLQVTFSVSAQE